MGSTLLIGRGRLLPVLQVEGRRAHARVALWPVWLQVNRLHGCTYQLKALIVLQHSTAAKAQAQRQGCWASTFSPSVSASW